jgi:hypothetical protein
MIFRSGIHVEYYRPQDGQHASPLRHLRPGGFAPRYAASFRFIKPLNDPFRRFQVTTGRRKGDNDNTVNSCIKCGLAWCPEGDLNPHGR